MEVFFTGESFFRVQTRAARANAPKPTRCFNSARSDALVQPCFGSSPRWSRQRPNARHARPRVRFASAESAAAPQRPASVSTASGSPSSARAAAPQPSSQAPTTGFLRRLSPGFFQSLSLEAGGATVLPKALSGFRSKSLSNF